MENNFDLPYEINFCNYDVQSPEELIKILDGYDNITYTEDISNRAEEIINTRFNSLALDHIPGMNIVFENMINNLKVTPLDAWVRQFPDEKDNENNIISNVILNGRSDSTISIVKDGE